QHHFTNIFASRFANAIEHQMYKEPRGAEGSEDKARKAPDATAGQPGAPGEDAPGQPGVEQPEAPGAEQPGAGVDAPSPDEIGERPPRASPAVPQPDAPVAGFSQRGCRALRPS